MHRVRVGDHFHICHEAIECTSSDKKGIKHKNTKCNDFVSHTVFGSKLLIFCAKIEYVTSIYKYHPRKLGSASDRIKATKQYTVEILQHWLLCRIEK